MLKKSKKTLVALVVTVLSVSCSNQTQKADNYFVTKAVTPNLSIQPSSPPDPNFKLPVPLSNLKPPAIEKGKINDDKPNFDVLPSYDLEAIDGAITVIYKNSHKIRIDKVSKKLKSKIGNDISSLDTLLGNNGLIDMDDMGSDYNTENEMDKMQSDFQKERGVDIPHMKSIHYYRFAKGTDTKQLCSELMKSPFVRLAYPTPVTVTTASTTMIGNNVGSNPSPPSDPFFSYPENTDWNWFNKHKVFKAWNEFGSTPLPNIAVIDFGFNPNSNEINFGNGYKIVDGVLTNSVAMGNCPSNACVQELPTDDGGTTFSHGSMVSSVLAGKKNNGVALCGIIPNAKITPIKIVRTSNTAINPMAKAIEVARNDSNVDVINISQATKYYYSGNNFIHVPLSATPDFNTQISYAVAQGKPVVITSGNNEVNPTLPPYNQIIPTTDAIVVGGSEPSSISDKQKAWTTDDGSLLKGANYNSSGQNFVDITASAYKIQATAYHKVAGVDTTTQATGTSFSAPMVAATLGMMKKINSSLTAKQLKDIIIFSSNVYKYDDGYNGLPSTKFMGKDLFSSSVNNGSVAGIRDLNAYNAVVIAKNINSYSAITRNYNIDDYVVSINSLSSSTFPYPGDTIDTYGTDFIYGVNSINFGSYFNFAEYNSSGGCAYGYQVYIKKPNVNIINFFDKLGGVSGVSGSPNCTVDWNYLMSYQY